MSCIKCDHYSPLGGGIKGVVSKCKIGKLLFQKECSADTSIDDRDRSKFEGQTLGAGSTWYRND